MSIQDIESQTLLNDMTHRIKSIAFLHEKLYKSQDLIHLNMKDYLSRLINAIKKERTYQDIHFDIKCEEIYLDLEISMPIGLIINELIINITKYAFDKELSHKMIRIKLYRSTIKNLILIVSDNGKGVILSEIENDFGLDLVEVIVKEELKGSIEVIQEERVEYRMTFDERISL